MITIYNHRTHPIWSSIYKRRFKRLGKTNGAYTYSQDIVKHHLPVIIDILNKQKKYKNILISTVATLSENIIPKNIDLIIEYIHESAVRDIPKCIKLSENTKCIFVTSREESYNKLKDAGIDCVFIPMAIDTEKFDEYKNSNKYTGKRVIYFGNKYLGKDGYYRKTKDAFLRKGWTFDEISCNIFNGKLKLDREEILETISKYKYGIGEGRCFLELNALGVKTLICASTCQGIITNDTEFELHKLTNFADGKVWTFSKSIQECIDNFDKAIIKTVDVSEILPILEKGIREIVNANN